MIKVICHAPGCMRTSVEGKHFCTKHINKEAEYLQNKKRVFTKRTTSAAYNNLYRTARWRRERAEFLRAYPYCVRCGQLATIVDHITPHKGNLTLFWAHTNWQPMCMSCHSAKTLKENGNFNNATKRT